MPIQITEMVVDQDFAQSFVVIRSTGSFQAGGWQNTTQNMTMYGVIEVADSHELEMVPEGDRAKGAMMFHTELPLYVTNADPQLSATGHLSDQITWRGNNYRLMSVRRWSDFGYYSAVGVRMSGE
jgi:hypothetical protein